MSFSSGGIAVIEAKGVRYRSGLVFGLIAYLWWGAVPLYFAQLKDAGVPALEILAQRITWSLPVLLVFIIGGGAWNDLFRVLARRKLVLVLLASSLFLAANWLLYIYATVAGRVTEASLGYYMMPLVNAALGTLFLGERLRRLHYPALFLVALGVAIPFIASGSFTWIAVMLPISFGLYGLLRKMAPVESITGLAIESLLMLPLSVGYLLYLNAEGKSHFGIDRQLDAWLAFSGIVTVIPLAAFTISLRRLPLLAISFLQFVSPTVQMLLAIFVLGEPALSPDRIAAFACIWLAVVIFIVDAIRQASGAKSRRRTEAVEM
ncbi:MAG TPA: EamA family transporter RarD [Urbifossiella sp.]|nr:EamA family transporter RarD [Urbifossiella sp.]